MLKYTKIQNANSRTCADMQSLHLYNLLYTSKNFFLATATLSQLQPRSARSHEDALLHRVIYS